MARPPLPVGTYGSVSRTAIVRQRVSPAGEPPRYQETALVTVDRKHYLPSDTDLTNSVKPTRFVARARFRDFDGTTRRVEAWGETAAAAERNLIASLQDRAEPTTLELSGESRISKAAELWMADVEAGKLSEATKERYRRIVKSHLDGIGSLRAREVKVSMLNRMLETVATKHGQQSARLTRTVLIGIFGRLVAEDAVKTNMAEQTRPVSVPAKEVRALSVKEVQTLRLKLRTDPLAVRSDLPDVVDMMLATGVRIGEVLAIRWADLDLDPAEGPATVKITGTVVRVKGNGLDRQGHLKTAAGRRRLILPDFVVDVLKARAEKIVELNPFGVVFPSSAQTLRDPHRFRDQWREARDRGGFDWVVPHTFRKSVATVLASEGAKVAADQLGHSGTRVTERHYIEKTHSGPDARALLDSFDQGMKGHAV